MQDDRAKADGTTAGQGHCAVYVCPKGFSGNYRILVRRVWGEVTTGKVTVEVITHYRTPGGKSRPAEDLPGQGRGHGRSSTLADGRRKEAFEGAAGGQRGRGPSGRQPAAADPGAATRRA